MEREKLVELFESIKKDNVKSFSSVMLSNSDLNIRFGRFPILSLLYLYEANSILLKYEKLLMPIHNYKEEFEPFDAYKKFKTKAKKSLKLFAGEKIIYPIEMLAVVDGRAHLKDNFKILHKNEEIVNNIAKIYNLTHNLEIEVSGECIVVSRKPLSFKQRIIAASVCAVFALLSLFSVVSILIVGNGGGLGTKKNPILISSAAVLSSLPMSSGRYYKLTKDIEITEKFEAKKFSGNIDGNGYSIFAEENLVAGMFTEFSGTVKNLTIYATYKNFAISQDFGVFAQKSTGIIDNVNVICGFSAKTYNDEAIYIAGIVATNEGTISNSSAKVDGDIKNERNSDAFISMIAGKNSGTIVGCKSLGTKIIADTVDMAGIVAENNGKVEDCLNETELSQTSEKEWNPNVAGIAMTNNGEIISSKNTGVIRATSTLDTNENNNSYGLYAAGIACTNTGKITACENSGEVYGVSSLCTNYVGGIVGVNYANAGTTASIAKCKSQANLFSNTESSKTNVGGIAAQNYCVVGMDFFGAIMHSSDAEVENCFYSGKITTNAKTAFVGGLVGENYYGKIKNSYVQINFENARDEALETNFFAAALVSGTYNHSSTYGYNQNYLDNNYYARGSTFVVAVNRLIEYSNNVINVQEIQNTMCGANELNSLDELPEGVRL